MDLRVHPGQPAARWMPTSQGAWARSASSSEERRGSAEDEASTVSLEELLDRADRKMYEEKAAAKSRR